jgi:Protein of unknown function (DUF1566)
MKKVIISLSFFLFIGISVFAQMGINTDNSAPDPSAMLDVKSNSKGMLIPRMTQSQISAITTPANGLFVFCTTDNKFYAYVASAIVWKEVLYGSGTIAPNTVPSVTTTAVTDITQTTATSGGNVTSDGGASVTARGVCWSLSSSPTTADSHTTDGSGTGVFVSNLTGLTANTLYYVRAYSTNSVGTAYGNQMSFTTTGFTIGQSYGGGIIFYIDGSGQHGLISAPTDQGTVVTWGCYEALIGGTGTAIGTGQANTTLIVNLCSTAGIAARICDDLVLNGYSDWFLPSQDELNQMYLQRIVIGGFPSNVYWSSSEYDAIYAWSQAFGYGSQVIHHKNGTYYVRAVRAF